MTQQLPLQLNIIFEMPDQVHFIEVIFLRITINIKHR